MQLRVVITALACLAASCAFLGTPGMAGQIEHKRFAAKAYPNSRDRDYKVLGARVWNLALRVSSPRRIN
jgi:hypothetical protein